MFGTCDIWIVAACVIDADAEYLNKTCKVFEAVAVRNGYDGFGFASCLIWFIIQEIVKPEEKVFAFVPEDDPNLTDVCVHQETTTLPDFNERCKRLEL